jgi:aryl-phospho-beta-D-glucosidase BglC (GH1 family)
MFNCEPDSVNASDLSAKNNDFTKMRGLTASQLVADMGPGWNLGNALESENNETAWGNPVTTKQMIDIIAAKGFKTLRVPVRWDDSYSNPSTYTIKPEFMNRVEEVVNYGLQNGMYVIINIHHNDLQSMVSTDPSVQKRVKEEMTAIWKQVGTRFKNYGDMLILETVNEPRMEEDWNGITALYECVNEYNEVSRAAIRSTGGNNSSRLIMMPTYAASSDSPKISTWKKLANDDMIAVSIHAYLPFDFAFDGKGHSNWTESDYYDLNAVFLRLNSTFIKKGLPVVMGEFGATGKENVADREKFAKAYAKFAKKYHMPCIWWDNNLFGKGAEMFGIFDRSSLTFVYGGIADAIINVYKTNQDDDDDDNNAPLFKGSSSASNWGQAVTAPTSRYGGRLDPSEVKQGGYFYVEYSGTKDQVELIFQSLSGGNNWCKVSMSESGSINGHYFAKYSYDNCVKAFGSDFENLLDIIHVGATDKPVTVYLLSYNHK